MRWILAVLLFYTAPIDALRPDSIRVDSLLVVATISYDFRGTRSWESLYLTLGLQEMAPGRRDFRVVVEDLQSQQKAMASEGFRVMW